MIMKKFDNVRRMYENNIYDFYEYDFSEEMEKDPDQCQLAFDIYYKILKAMGCKEIKAILNCSNFRDSGISSLFGENALSLIEENVQEQVKKQVMNIKIRKIGNRSGFYFKYKNKYYALEVDTVIGPNFYDKSEGMNLLGKPRNLLHTVGNFGLIPFGAGRCAGPGGITDAPYYKIKERFSIYPSGFESYEELGELMLYNKIDNEKKGFFDINLESTKEEINECIRIRGNKIIEVINSKYNEFGVEF